MPPEAPVAPAVPDATIVTQPPTPPPVAPELKVYPDPVKPADPPVVPPPAKPADPAAITPPPIEPKPPAEPAKPGDPASPAPVPAEYDLKLPIGSLVSAEEVKALTERSKKAGYSKEQAETLLQERVEATQALAQRQQTQMTELRKQWTEEAKNDPVYGGDKFNESAEKAARVVNRFAPPELKRLLDETGMGNNPYVFRFIANMANVFSEDQLVRGTAGTPEAKKSPEEILYGKTTPGAQGS